MNDDFLHRIRVEPPEDFLARLKTRLDRQPQPRPRRSIFRVLAFGLLFAGSVFAITLLTVDGVPEAVRTLIRVQHEQPGAESANTEDSANPADKLHRSRPMLAGGRHPETENATGHPHLPKQMPATAGTHADGVAGATSTSSPKSPAATVGLLGAPQTEASVLAPKALHEYAIAFARRVHGTDATAAVKDVDTSTEALAQLCAVQKGPRYFRGPTMAITTRRITHAEFETCTHTIDKIVEVPMGHQAIALVRSRAYGPLNLSPRDIFLAVAAEIPDPAHAETTIANPYTTWSMVNGSLETEPIEVSGPSLSSITGMAFRDLILEAGCNTFPWIAALKHTDAARYERICHTVRKDGVYVEVAEIPGDMTQRLQLNPNMVGIVGYALIPTRPNSGIVTSQISAVAPTLDAIVNDTYPASRSLYIYILSWRAGPIEANAITVFAEQQGTTLETLSLVPADPTRARGTPNTNPIRLLDLKL